MGSLQLLELFGVAGGHVVRVISGGEKSINAMNGLVIRVAADLEELIII
jgi:precorrin-3B methylase